MMYRPGTDDFIDDHKNVKDRTRKLELRRGLWGLHVSFYYTDGARAHLGLPATWTVEGWGLEVWHLPHGEIRLQGAVRGAGSGLDAYGRILRNIPGAPEYFSSSVGPAITPMPFLVPGASGTTTTRVKIAADPETSSATANLILDEAVFAGTRTLYLDSVRWMPREIRGSYPAPAEESPLSTVTYQPEDD